MPVHSFWLHRRVRQVYHRSCLLASQANGLVQELGHLLVVGMVLSTRPAGNEAIVLQLCDVLVREPLHHIMTC